MVLWGTAARVGDVVARLVRSKLLALALEVVLGLKSALRLVQVGAWAMTLARSQVQVAAALVAGYEPA